MKRAFSLLATLALAACGGGTLDADEVRGALPFQENAQIAAPQSQAASGKTGAQAAAVASDSGYFNLTRDLAASVNLGVGTTLGWLRFLVSLPPTQCKDDTCTWGPGHGPFDYNEFKLTVTRNGGQYDYALSGRPLASGGDFIVFLSGSAIPGGSPRRGHGTLTVDFDQVALLDGPHGDTGRIEVSYDARQALYLGVRFLGMLDKNPAVAAGTRVNAAYAFQASADGGDLQVASRTVAPAPDVRLSLHSRWLGTGAGRGDVRVVAGTQEAAKSECWGPAPFPKVYDSSAAAFGPESSCAFLPAVYATLQAP